MGARWLLVFLTGTWVRVYCGGKWFSVPRCCPSLECVLSSLFSYLPSVFIGLSHSREAVSDSRISCVKVESEPGSSRRSSRLLWLPQPGDLAVGSLGFCLYQPSTDRRPRRFGGQCRSCSDGQFLSGEDLGCYGGHGSSWQLFHHRIFLPDLNEENLLFFICFQPLTDW